MSDLTILEEKNYKRLEYDKILAILASHCISEPGKQKALSLRPYTTLPEAQLALGETDEALCYLFAKGNPPLSGLNDVTGSIGRAALQATLTTRELLDIARVIGTISAMKEYGKWDRDDKRFEILGPYFSALNPPTGLGRSCRTSASTKSAEPIWKSRTSSPA